MQLSTALKTRTTKPSTYLTLSTTSRKSTLMLTLECIKSWYKSSRRRLNSILKRLSLWWMQEARVSDSTQNSYSSPNSKTAKDLTSTTSTRSRLTTSRESTICSQSFRPRKGLMNIKGRCLLWTTLMLKQPWIESSSKTKKWSQLLWLSRPGYKKGLWVKLNLKRP